MKTRPKIFLYMSLFMFGIACSLPGQIFFLYGHGLSEWQQAFAKVAPMNWAVCGLCFLCAFLSWRASPLLKLFVPITVLAVAWNNWIVGAAALDYSALGASAGFLAFAALQGGWFHPEAVELFRHPQKRWWLTPRRQRMGIPVFVEIRRGETVKTQTYDISAGGLFLPFGLRELNNHPSAHLARLPIGSKIELNLVVNPLHTVHCEAEVVRTCTEATGDYPAGIGVRFLHLQARTQEDIQHLLAA